MRNSKLNKETTKLPENNLKRALVTPYLSKTILNVNGLNSSIKRHRVAMTKKTKCCLHTAYKRLNSA